MKAKYLIGGLLCTISVATIGNVAAMEAGKVVKLVAQNPNKKDGIIKTEFYETVRNGDCAGARYLLDKLKPIADISKYNTAYFYICEKSTDVVIRTINGLQGDDEKREVFQNLRVRLESAQTQDEFVRTSQILLESAPQTKRKYTGYWSFTYLLLNVQKHEEAEKDFAVTYSTSQSGYEKTAELIKFAKQDPAFVADFLFKTHNVGQKDMYLEGIHEWIGKYPESVVAETLLNDLLMRYQGNFSKEQLAEFLQFRNERKYHFFKYKVSSVCARDKEAIMLHVDNSSLDIKGIGPADQKIAPGWLLNVCVLVDTMTNEIAYLAPMASKAEKDYKLSDALPYYQHGWHENENCFDSTSPVAALSNKFGEAWLIERMAKDIPGEVGEHHLTYDVYKLSDDGPKKQQVLDGYLGGEGGESWAQEYMFFISSSGRLMANEISSKQEILDREIDTETIAAALFELNGGSKTKLSTSSHNNIFKEDGSGGRKPVLATITGTLYKKSDLTGPVQVSNTEVQVLSQLRGKTTTNIAVILEVAPLEHPDERWYMRPEAAGELSHALGRSY